MQQELLDLALKDGRYAWEAYEFALEALGHTQRMFGKEAPESADRAGPEHHVTGRELLEGICDLARREFGLMAPVVFERWGIHRTDDFGNIIFALIAAGVLYKTDSDTIEDFHDVFNLETVLTDGYRISAEDSESKRGLR